MILSLMARHQYHSLAVVLSGKAFATAWPLTYKGPFFGVRTQMTLRELWPIRLTPLLGNSKDRLTSKIKATSESAPTTGNRALEIGLVPSATCTGCLCRTGCDLLLLYLQNRRQTGTGGRLSADACP